MAQLAEGSILSLLGDQYRLKGILNWVYDMNSKQNKHKKGLVSGVIPALKTMFIMTIYNLCHIDSLNLF